MPDLLYISRNFTEFGGFKPEEVKDFFKRNVLLESDFVKVDGQGDWVPVNEWITTVSAEKAKAKANVKARLEDTGRAPAARPAKKAARANGKTAKA